MTSALSDSDSRAAFAAARDLCRQSEGVAREAYRAAFFLPREKREAIYAVAAFAGLIQQAMDARGGGGGEGCCGGGDGVAAVVRSRIDALYAEQIELPLPEFRDASQWIFAAMADMAKRFEVPRAYLHELVDGLSADRTVKRYATWNALRRHCELVGGSMAKVAACVLGVKHSDGAMFATKLGIAHRLVGIFRHLTDDLAKDRVYLPLEDVARFRCSAFVEQFGRSDQRDGEGGSVINREAGGASDASNVAAVNFRELIGFEVARARELLREGTEGLCWLADDGSRMAAATLVATQGGVLDAIERAGETFFAADLRLSPARRLRQLSTAWRLARRTADEPLPPLPRVG